MATLGVLHSHVARELGLDTDSSLSGNDATVVTEWLNRAVRDILVKTHVRVREFSMDLTAGTDEYSLDTDILQMLSLRSNDGSDDREMEPLTLDDLNRRRILGDTSSSPARFYTLLGSDMLILYPVPGTGESVQGEYVPKPTEMSAAAHDPANTTYGGIPIEFHDAVELYALWHGGRADDHQESARGNQYRAEYYQRVAEMKAELNRKRGVRKPHARVRRRGSSRVTSDPSRAWF